MIVKKIMSEVQDESVDSTLDKQAEEIETNNELDNILDALDPGDETPAPKKEADVPAEEKKEGEGDEPYKKVGTLSFKTEEEYDKWALKAYGENTRLSGELNKLKKSIDKQKVDKPESKPTETKVPSATDIRWQIKVEDFFEENPDAENYRAEMAVFLKTGKANNEAGKPDLGIAFKKSLLADGKEIPAKVEPKGDNLSNQKRIMRSGGGDSSRTSYQEDSDLSDLDSFADKAILKRV